MKLLLDMNLSPFLVILLSNAEWETVHWANVGNPRATDQTILTWAQKNGYSIITNDLDFSAILAATKEKVPSVIQVRTQDVSPIHLMPILRSVLSKYKTFIENGALISVDEARARVRVLPLQS